MVAGLVTGNASILAGFFCPVQVAKLGKGQVALFKVRSLSEVEKGGVVAHSLARHRVVVGASTTLSQRSTWLSQGALPAWGRGFALSQGVLPAGWRASITFESTGMFMAARLGYQPGHIIGPAQRGFHRCRFSLMMKTTAN